MHESSSQYLEEPRQVHSFHSIYLGNQCMDFRNPDHCGLRCHEADNKVPLHGTDSRERRCLVRNIWDTTEDPYTDVVMRCTTQTGD